MIFSYHAVPTEEEMFFISRPLLVECFFQKIKWFRRIATRFDKSDASFLAFVYLASIAILLL